MRDGQYYVSQVKVKLQGKSTAKHFLLKCPWDFTPELMSDPENVHKGTSLITAHVDSRVKWSKMIRKMGPFAVRIEKYDDGTLIVERPEETRDLGEALKWMSPDQREKYLSRSKQLLRKIERDLGLRYVGRTYVGSESSEFTPTFVVTRDGRILLEDLDFETKSEHKLHPTVG